MRHEDAGLALWLATDPSRPEHRSPCEEGTARVAVARSSIRRRAGAAVIAIGEWLAGEPRERGRVTRRRPLAGQAS